MKDFEKVMVGILLVLCALAALVMANVPVLQDVYFPLLKTDIGICAGGLSFSMSLLHWINDGLMAVFFFAVGMEIKREILYGELSSPKKAMLPVFAAIGGMLCPALIYMLFNCSGEASSGWGIPMATDIAFAIGILSLLGNRCPLALKVFLTALAIVDDLGAILVLALFYPSGEIEYMYLLYALVILAVLFLFNRAGFRSAAWYIVPGVALWYAVYMSGVHATIAGVLLAMTIPSGQGKGGGQPLLHRLEHRLFPWVNYLIMPVFALANAGVPFTAGSFSLWPPESLSYGIFFGLLLGKPIGIFLFSRLAVALRMAKLPDGVCWKQLAAIGVFGGIGFTMSIFIDNLAFSDLRLVFIGKATILVSSVSAALAGLAAMVITGKHVKQKLIN